MLISILQFFFHLVAFSTCRITLYVHNDLCVAVHIQTLFFHFINSTFELERVLRRICLFHYLWKMKPRKIKWLAWSLPSGVDLKVYWALDSKDCSPAYILPQQPQGFSRANCPSNPLHPESLSHKIVNKQNDCCLTTLSFGICCCTAIIIKTKNLFRKFLSL